MSTRKQPTHNNPHEQRIIRCDIEPRGWLVTYTGRQWLAAAANRLHYCVTLADAADRANQVQQDVRDMASGFKGWRQAREALIDQARAQQQQREPSMHNTYNELVRLIERAGH